MEIRKQLILAIVIVLLGGLSVAVFAQEGSPPPTPTSTPVVEPKPTAEPTPVPEPIELPETAVGAVATLVILLGTLGALVTEYGTEIIKRLPLIKSADKEKISSGWAKFAAAFVGLLTTVVQVYGILGAEWLDENGVWAFLLFVLNAGGANLLHRVLRNTKRNPGPLSGSMVKRASG